MRITDTVSVAFTEMFRGPPMHLTRSTPVLTRSMIIPISMELTG